ncbi:MAG: DegV family protein, partial [Clostridia bacterium]|nr:DegV family protein [Clostridia bacterium]
MRDYVILVDSSSEMTTEKRKEFGVDYIQMKIAYDGKEYPASLDWDAYSAKELYGWLRDGKRVTTMQVPPEDYRQAFAVYLEKGLDIFYLACS